MLQRHGRNVVRTEVKAMLAINEASKDFYFRILYYYRLRQESGTREKILGHGQTADNNSSEIVVEAGGNIREDSPRFSWYIHFFPAAGILSNIRQFSTMKGASPVLARIHAFYLYSQLQLVPPLGGCCSGPGMARK
jgi:hypothetical protein